MANTYTKIYIHLVFAVKYRRGQIPLSHSDEVYRYIAAIINKSPKCEAIMVGGAPDHVHILYNMPPNHDISDLVKNVKVSTTNFINDKGIVAYHNFKWQEGYGAFSVSATHVEAVTAYIANQLEHHLGKSFLEEYRELLLKNNVSFQDEYLFQELM